MAATNVQVIGLTGDTKKSVPPNSDLNGKSLKSLLETSLKAHHEPKKIAKLLNAMKKNWVKPSFFLYRKGGHVLCVTYFKGMNDRFLINLANDRDGIGFPRGFAMIWDPVSCVILATAAFLDKFENDDPTSVENSIGSDLIDECDRVQIAKKMSGSLIIMTAFEFNGQKFLFIGSKNATGNIFSEEAYNLLVQWFNNSDAKLERFVDYLSTKDDQKTIAFEMCCQDGKFGQHGSAYNTSLLVSLVVLQTSRPERFVVPVKDEIVMPTFLDLGLPVEDRFIVRKEMMSAFSPVIGKLNLNRDFMTNTLFDQIITEAVNQGIVQVIKGSINHATLSDVLEGLIIWLHSSRHSEKAKIVKYKFPLYTRMTMCLRTMLVDTHLVIPSKPFKLYPVKKAVEFWAQRWVINPENRKLHIQRLLKVCSLLSEIDCKDPLTPLSQNNYLDLVEPIVRHVDTDPSVLDFDFNVYELTPMKVILIIGFVGSGKTQVVKMLRRYGISCVSSDDCDEDIANGGAIKNNRAYGEPVYYYAQNPSVPVAIENGVGLFYNNDHIVIIKELEKRALTKVEIVAVITPQILLDFVNAPDITGLEEIIVSKTEDTVQSRFARGELVLKPGITIWNNEFPTVKSAKDIFVNVTKRNINPQLDFLRTVISEMPNVRIVPFDLEFSVEDGRPVVKMSDDDLVYLTGGPSSSSSSGPLTDDNELTDDTTVTTVTASTFTWGISATATLTENTGKKLVTKNMRGHITSGYGADFVTTHERVSALEHELSQMEQKIVTGRLVTIQEGDGSKSSDSKPASRPASSKSGAKPVPTYRLVVIPPPSTASSSSDSSNSSDSSDRISYSSIMPPFAHMTIDTKYKASLNKMVTEKISDVPTNTPTQMMIDGKPYIVTLTDEIVPVLITGVYVYALP